MTILSTTVGMTPSDEMEWPAWSPKESEMQYLDYTYGWFMLRFDRKQQNSVKQLSSNKNINKNKTNKQTKNTGMISLRFQGKPFNITIIQVYAPTSNTEEMKLNGSVDIYKTF